MCRRGHIGVGRVKHSVARPLAFGLCSTVQTLTGKLPVEMGQSTIRFSAASIFKMVAVGVFFILFWWAGQLGESRNLAAVSEMAFSLAHISATCHSWPEAYSKTPGKGHCWERTHKGSFVKTSFLSLDSSEYMLVSQTPWCTHTGLMSAPDWPCFPEESVILEAILPCMKMDGVTSEYTYTHIYIYIFCPVLSAFVLAGNQGGATVCSTEHIDIVMGPPLLRFCLRPLAWEGILRSHSPGADKDGDD